MVYHTYVYIHTYAGWMAYTYVYINTVHMYMLPVSIGHWERRPQTTFAGRWHFRNHKSPTQLSSKCMNCVRRSQSSLAMGNSASTAVARNLDGKKIYDLSNSELLVLLSMHTWSKDELLQVAKSLKAVDISKSGFYSSDDTPETDLAVRLNALSKDVAKLRFQLVPSLLKEAIFWESVFSILKERLVEHNARYQLQNTETEGDESVASHMNGHPPPPSNSDHLVQSLQAQLAVKDKKIADLQNQLEYLRSVPQEKPVTHAGTWMMHTDSQEFLQFPDEVKANMRKEKQRRLRQVQQDMEFILDSDHIEDSKGYWTCCGHKEYRTNCPKAQ